MHRIQQFSSQCSQWVTNILYLFSITLNTARESLLDFAVLLRGKPRGVTTGDTSLTQDYLHHKVLNLDTTQVFTIRLLNL